MTLAGALRLLESGAVLVLTHGEGGDSYWLEPGGRLEPHLAKALFDRLELRPGGDALIDGEAPQTWAASRVVSQYGSY